METENLKNICTQTRRDIVRMVHGAQSGHPGGSLGCVEFMVALYNQIMYHQPKPFDMNGIGQDLFFLSNGHISPVWYSVLARSGYFDVAELATFRFINTRLQGHPTTHEHLPGVRVASGSLGQGLSVALGAAQSKKLNGDDKLVYVLMGDGELGEGQVWEAAIYAAAKKVDNIQHQLALLEIKLNEGVNEPLVFLMKQIVPDYKSNNSMYEKLDNKTLE